MGPIIRYRVRRPSQGWEERGPDLLRKPANAVSRIREFIPVWVRTVVVNSQDGMGWIEATRKDLAEMLRHWDGTGLFVVDRVKRDGTRLHLAIVDRVEVPILQLASTSPDTVRLWSLIRGAFPDVLFAGSYVWKQTYPGYWSDHAWGTAVDATPRSRLGVDNDRIIDWLARMRRTRNVTFDYVLGSRAGHVVKCYKLGVILPSGADSSHLWHTHASRVDHGGAQPPRPGGVW